jgi:D-lyxose ketol-isomerase
VGDSTATPHARPPAERAATFTVWHEVVLRPGEQYTIMPNTLHWFQGGPEGAVVSEFSTRSRDEFDIFTDPEIRRAPVISD